MLSQLEMEQAELSEKNNFLDIHLYITTFSETKDMKTVTLKLALNLMHQKVISYQGFKDEGGIIQIFATKTAVIFEDHAAEFWYTSY